MASENLSKYYPITIKFSGYIPLYEDTSAIDFRPDRSTRLKDNLLNVFLFISRS